MVKSFVPKHSPSNARIRSKKSRSNVVQSKYGLAWYVALNTEPTQEKLSHISQIKWKCPPKFTFNINWHVASGERSQEVEVQKHRETTVVEATYSHLSAIPLSPLVSLDTRGEFHDNNQIVHIPIIPIDETAGETPTRVSVDSEPVNIDINPQLRDSPKIPSTSLNQKIPSGNLSGSPKPPINDESVLGMLSGLEGGDLAVAAAATVAAVMESKERIDIELLIKFLSDPEMIKKLIDENGLRAEPERETISIPIPSALFPLTSSGSISSARGPSTLPPMPSSGSIFSAPGPSTLSPLTSSGSIFFARGPSTFHPLPSSGFMSAHGPSTLFPLPSLGTTSTLVPITQPSLPSLGSISVPGSNTFLPLPSPRSLFPVDNLTKGCSRAIPSISIMQPLAQSHVPPSINVGTSLNVSKWKEVATHARTALIFTPYPVNKSIPFARSKLSNEPVQAHIYQVAGMNQVRSQIPPIIKFNEDESDRLAKRYGAPFHTRITPVTPLNPSIPKPNLEVFKKMINEYGASDAKGGIIPSLSKPITEEMKKMINEYGRDEENPGAPLMQNMEEMKKMIKEYGALDNPGYRPLLEPNHPFQSNFAPAGMISFPSLKDPNYYKSLIKQHGENHENEHKFRNFGQPGNHLQGQNLAQNMVPIEMNPNYQSRPLMNFNSHMGYQNGNNYPYEQNTSNRWSSGGMMDVPVAKRMKFCELNGNNLSHWQ